MYCLLEQQSAASTNASNEDEENIFTDSHYDSDTNSCIPEEQEYERIFTESDIHPWLACDSAEEMISQAQPQYTTLQEITDWEMESTDYDNIVSTEEVGPDPVTCNALTTLTMYDPTKEFPELFADEVPTELPALRYPMEIMQHRIDIIPNSHWSPRFSSTYNQFKDQITEKINIELGTERVAPSRSSNTIGIFTQPKRDKPDEARFQLHCIPRNLVTHQDKTPISSMEQIIEFVVSGPFRSKLDLTDGYHKISIHPESVKYSTVRCHIGKYDSLVIQ